MTPEKTLLSLINLFDIYRKNPLGINIPSDDCTLLYDGLIKLVEKYNIKFDTDKTK